MPERLPLSACQRIARHQHTESDDLHGIDDVAVLLAARIAPPVVAARNDLGAALGEDRERQRVRLRELDRPGPAVAEIRRFAVVADDLASLDRRRMLAVERPALGERQRAVDRPGRNRQRTGARGGGQQDSA